jgi:1-acyl-sn-glycerol-3-phosphate acyltransferase
MSDEIEVYPDTYAFLERSTLLLFGLLGGLFVRGEGYVPKEGPVLLVSNHTSYIDPCAIGDACPRRVVFMAKTELFEKDRLNRLLRGVDAFPVKRGEPDMTAFKTALSRLKDNRVVCVFPEGTRQPTEEQLGPPEKGAAVFAQKMGCPVVPVYVDGALKMLGQTGGLHRSKVTVSFGPVFFVEKSMDRDAAGALLMEKIADVRDHQRSTPARRLNFTLRKRPLEGSRAS